MLALIILPTAELSTSISKGWQRPLISTFDIRHTTTRRGVHCFTDEKTQLTCTRRARCIITASALCGERKYILVNAFFSRNTVSDATRQVSLVNIQSSFSIPPSIYQKLLNDNNFFTQISPTLSKLNDVILAPCMHAYPTGPLAYQTQ